MQFTGVIESDLPTVQWSCKRIKRPLLTVITFPAKKRFVNLDNTVIICRFGKRSTTSRHKSIQCITVRLPRPVHWNVAQPGEPCSTILTSSTISASLRQRSLRSVWVKKKKNRSFYVLTDPIDILWQCISTSKLFWTYGISLFRRSFRFF